MGISRRTLAGAHHMAYETIRAILRERDADGLVVRMEDTREKSCLPDSRPKFEPPSSHCSLQHRDSLNLQGSLKASLRKDSPRNPNSRGTGNDDVLGNQEGRQGHIVLKRPLEPDRLSR